MKKLLATTAILAMAATPALAGPDTDISQTLNGVQDVVNSVNTIHNSQPVNQEGTNLANIVSLQDVTVDDAVQNATGDQNVDNNLYSQYGHFNFGSGQDGTNILNMTDVGFASSVNQSVSSTASQRVDNAANYGGSLEDFNQAGTNVMNYQMTNNFGVSSQTTSLGNTQDVVNSLGFNGSGNHEEGALRDVTQAGTNLSNVVISSGLPSMNGVQEMTQTANANQGVVNTINGNGTLDNVLQSGTNVANMVTLPSLD